VRFSSLHYRKYLLSSRLQVRILPGAPLDDAIGLGVDSGTDQLAACIRVHLIVRAIPFRNFVPSASL
jgi:hypothetical protein